jgi:hypothetical protein
MAAERGFRSEKEMFAAYVEKHGNFPAIHAAEFPEIREQTIRRRAAKVGVRSTYGRRFPWKKEAARRGFGTVKEMLEVLKAGNSSAEVAKKLSRGKVKVHESSVRRKMHEIGCNFEYLDNGRPPINLHFNSVFHKELQKYSGYDPPCKNCNHSGEDKLDPTTQCFKCCLPMAWHDNVWIKKPIELR